MKINTLSLSRTRRGFSLLEMIVYIAILTFLVSIVVLLLSGIINSEKRLVASKNIQVSSLTALDRITREIRQAQSVDVAGSTLGTSTGVLKLNSIDSAGTTSVVLFSIQGGIIHIFVNGVDKGPLSLQNTKVTSLYFSIISTPKSQAVKVQMTLESGNGNAYKSEIFYSTIMLRGSY